MDNLGEDVIGEILTRLPVKTLVGLKSVCKSWRSCISNPYFASLQIRRNMANPDYNDSFIAHYYHKGSPRVYNPGYHKLYVFNKNVLDKPINLNLPLPTSNSPDRFDVVGSCNGLLCLSYLGKPRTTRQKRVYLWNPATGQLKDIHINKQKIEYGVSLGFGFDCTSNDYKVVHIVSDKFRVVRVEVYSLNQNSWKTIDHVELEFRVVQPYAAVVRGLFYWLTCEKFGFVSFNVQSGKFSTTRLPDGINCHHIFELKESVAISTGYICDQGIGIWKLDDDRSWIKIRTIKNDRVRAWFGCLNTGEYVGTGNGELALCDHANKVIRYVTQLPKDALRTYNYSASLVNLS
ncbi:F-box domain-containing protein [Heracleum sosnowskyi]|uniref:F-box domain-containing protein n=1 Tax=Heracleum sosnowskyi TaxID=360622 RepID=A0AAD8M493_9APIA|nr:F-box domain-containing protein [Heracleum sosnowskyi]